MIKGIHAMFNTQKAEDMRAFLRDKLGLPFTDVGDGWLIFGAPQVEIGCHPADAPSHELSFYTDDLEGTVAELRERGVEFTKDISDAGFGLITYFRLPDGEEVMLYQPKYTLTH